MTYTKNLHRGRFNPKNPEKYRGDVTSIVYRSGYEVKFMNWCDKNSDVTEWNSEEVVVPYRSPMDNKVHRYFIDFYIKVNGKQYLIEVKPDRFTRAPVIPKRKTKRFLNEVAQFAVNEAKWKSAREFCADRNLEFKIITEKELGISYK
jgi:hypothetical protein|tara:strand:- start:718 stop:1161 length:444 start_codon:yes stop_codon:yes gene_type:complete